MFPPGLCTIPWAHSLSSDVPYSFVVCAPRLLHPVFSDGQVVLPCLYEPLLTILETLQSAWSPHIAACLSALTGICSMPNNYFHPRNRGRVYHSCSMYSQTGRKSCYIFSFCSYSKFYKEYGVIEYLKGLYSVYDRMYSLCAVCKSQRFLFCGFSMRSLYAPTVYLGLSPVCFSEWRVRHY